MPNYGEYEAPNTPCIQLKRKWLFVYYFVRRILNVVKTVRFGLLKFFQRMQFIEKSTFYIDQVLILRIITLAIFPSLALEHENTPFSYSTYFLEHLLTNRTVV